MIKNEKRKMICTVLICANLAFIWGNSLMTGAESGALSGGILDWINRFLGLGEAGAQQLHHFILGALFCWRFGMAEQKKTHIAAFSFLGSLMAACADETIQIFVDGRGSSLLDVWTDAFGAMTGIIVLLLGHHLIVKKHS